MEMQHSKVAEKPLFYEMAERNGKNARGRPGITGDRSGFDLFTACPVGDFGKWRQIARNKVVVHSIPRVGPFHGHIQGFHYLRMLQY